MIFAANQCLQRSPNQYIAESEEEVQNILNPRIGDIAIVSTEDETSIFRLRESSEVDGGEYFLPSNKCEYVWVLSGPFGAGNLGVATVINVDLPPYRAAGNGVVDDTDSIADALADGGGNTVYFGPGKTYRITSPLTVSANTTIIAFGAKIINTSGAETIFHLNSGCRILGMEVEGNGNAAYDDLGRAFSLIGTVLNYISDVVISECYIHDVSGYGVYAEFAERVKISGGRIFNSGYAGAGFLSCAGCNVSGVHIKGVGPGTAGNAYNVFFSRRATNTSLAVFPRSIDCKADFNILEDNPLWEALDTHGGENIQFIGNTIRNCKYGIAVVASRLVAGVDGYAPLNCRVIGNNISGGLDGYGIAFAGALGASEGSPIERASGVISGNTLEDCGISNNSIAGAMFIHTTVGVSVVGNTLNKSRSNAICLTSDNESICIVGNMIHDAWDDVYTIPAGIAIRSSFNRAVISGNALLRDDTSLGVFVSVRGINVSIPADNETEINGNRNTFTTPYSGKFPVIQNLAGDGTSSLIQTHRTNSTVGIGGAANINYLLTVKRDGAGFQGAQIVENTTAGGAVGIQARSDTSQSWLRAYSATFGDAIFNDQGGVGVESISSALGLWAVSAGQYIAFYAGSSALSATIDIDGMDIVGSLNIGRAILQSVDVIAASDIDWSLGNLFSKSVGVNTVFTFSNAVSGQRIRVKVTALAAVTVAWPAVTWKGGVTPSQTADKTDFYDLFFDGTTYFGSADQDY